MRHLNNEMTQCSPKVGSGWNGDGVSATGKVMIVGCTSLGSFSQHNSTASQGQTIHPFTAATLTLQPRPQNPTLAMGSPNAVLPQSVVI